MVSSQVESLPFSKNPETPRAARVVAAVRMGGGGLAAAPAPPSPTYSCPHAPHSVCPWRRNTWPPRVAEWETMTARAAGREN